MSVSGCTSASSTTATGVAAASLEDVIPADELKTLAGFLFPAHEAHKSILPDSLRSDKEIYCNDRRKRKSPMQAVIWCRLACRL